MNNGTVWTWGNNDSGQLGNGTIIQNLVAAPIIGLTGVMALAGGVQDNIVLEKGRYPAGVGIQHQRATR